jgi:hypothetical protein
VSAVAVQRATFTTSRLLEFCSLKELVAQTGTSPDAWPMMVVKELVDNALDACEEHGVAPVIHVTVARNRIRVRDNGPGIPPATVASILDFATRTSSREAYVAPDRGRQGNARRSASSWRRRRGSPSAPKRSSRRSNGQTGPGWRRSPAGFSTASATAKTAGSDR